MGDLVVSDVTSLELSGANHPRFRPGILREPHLWVLVAFGCFRRCDRRGNSITVVTGLHPRGQRTQLNESGSYRAGWRGKVEILRLVARAWD